MKRLALVLAAVGSIGSGCYGGTTCSRTITLDWSAGFITADGGTVGCSTSSPNIRFIDVWVNDQFATSFDCSAVRGTVGIPSGSNLITVEAVDAANAIIYRDEFNTDTSVCGNQAIATRPAEGRVNLDYSVSSAPPCPDGPCFVWFSVSDNIAGVTAAAITQNTAGYEYPNDIVFRLAAGPYTVDWMQIRSSGGLLELMACTTPTFTVSPGSLSLPPGQQQLVPSTPVLLKASCP